MRETRKEELTREFTVSAEKSNMFTLCLEISKRDKNRVQEGMKPKVTVGFCVRNKQDFIADAIMSVKDQNYPHELMEAIFIDDDSRDETLSVIKSYAPKMDMNVKVFHQAWKGLGSARNSVIAKALGQYIIWVDGDMVLSPDYVAKHVEFVDQNLSVGIAKGQYSLDAGANLLATLEIYSRVASKMVNFNYHDKAHAKSMGAGGCIYRIKAIKQVGGFDETITGYGEDFDAEYRVRKAGWLLCIIPVQYRDYERRRILWRQLWTKYLQRGYDSHSFLRKNKGMINLPSMLPPAAFLAGLFHSLKIYGLTHNKASFLLPFQYALKNTAWFLGFVKAVVSVN